jgi:hypothetical protein
MSISLAHSRWWAVGSLGNEKPGGGQSRTCMSNADADDDADANARMTLSGDISGY